MNIDNSNTEVWSDLPSDLNLNKYEISTYGKVRNKRTGKILKINAQKKYAIISLINNENKKKNFQVHRLVALTFIPNPENKLTVDHINRDGQDNNINNLRWANATEQNANKGNYKHQDRKIIALCGEDILKIWDNISDTIIEFPNIQDYLTGKDKHIYYTFSYLDKTILPGEIFKYININDNNIKVSNLGRYYRERRKQFSYGTMHSSGYLSCSISSVRYHVARLVGLAFVERQLHLADIPYENLEINHIDGNKSNNISNNLEWVTPAENVRHSINNLKPEGIREITQYDLNGKFIANYKHSVEAALAINKPNGGSNIRECCRKKSVAYNYIWRYKEEELITLPKINKLNVPIVQYDLSGIVIAKHKNSVAAAKSVNKQKGYCNIILCCQRSHDTAYGYVWRYEGDELESSHKIFKPKMQILQYDLNQNFIRGYSTIKEASENTGICGSTICKCCKFKRNHAGGFIWRKIENQDAI